MSEVTIITPGDNGSHNYLIGALMCSLTHGGEPRVTSGQINTARHFGPEPSRPGKTRLVGQRVLGQTSFVHGWMQTIARCFCEGHGTSLTEALGDESQSDHSKAVFPKSSSHYFSA